jgi:hypothetical protein
LVFAALASSGLSRAADDDALKLRYRQPADADSATLTNCRGYRFQGEGPGCRLCARSGSRDGRGLAITPPSDVRDTQASVEIAATSSGTLLLDFVSMMRADVRRDGMLRPDLLQALRDLAPPFIRWPGGSFASTYKWKDGIGPHVSRRYHPNVMWGGYSDY